MIYNTFYLNPALLRVSPLSHVRQCGMGFFVKRCIEFQLYGQIYDLLDGADQGSSRLLRVVYQWLINLRFRARAPLRLKMFHYFRIFSPAKFNSQSARIRHMRSFLRKNQRPV